MDELLTAVSTTKPRLVETLDKQSNPSQPTEHARTDDINSPEQALAALRDQPNAETLRRILRYLRGTVSSSTGFNIRVPGSLAAQIINTLLNDTLPNYWDAWPETSSRGNDRILFLECLRSVGGIGAIVARLKSLTQELQRQQQQQVTKPHGTEQLLRITFEALTHLLQESLVQDLWQDINDFISAPTQRQLLWREFVSLTATGKIISVTAQAIDSLKSAEIITVNPWYASGTRYAEWLGCAIALFASKGYPEGTDPLNFSQSAAILLGKSFTIGYTDHVIWGFLARVSIQDTEKVSNFLRVLQRLRAHEQRLFLLALLRVLSEKVLIGASVQAQDLKSTSKAIAGSVALVQAIINTSEPLKESLVSWLTNSASGSASVSFATRRVAVAALQSDEDRICKVLERSMEQFGDELFIRHTPMLQQEALTQILLMSCGYIHRTQPMLLFTLARSSVHMKGTSNRLATSSQRARSLGMIAATSISSLIDKPENRLNFGSLDTESEEAQWYGELTKVHDPAGDIKDFEQPVIGQGVQRSAAVRPVDVFQKRAQQSREKHQDRVAAASSSRIIEIMDDTDQEDELVPYAKPDSDPEDDSEDPTQVTRNKATAPVYIRDLLAGLRDGEDYDRHQLALSNAASLIRRKTNFGKEVKDNIEELASIIVGLNDQFDLENFQEMRQQALIAVVLADPVHMGPYLASCFYAGDYSFSQRVAILTAIGLGAREMAGFKDDLDGQNTVSAPGQNFPSKMLPEKLHKIYSAESSPVDAITNKLKHSMISPLALDAADKVTGPNALKVRTFSSRMQVEKNRKIITNQLAKVVGRSFFFPLTGGWWSHAKALGAENTYYSPLILPVFLKTLAILLHSSGTSTLSLPQMTSELWDLLLSVRTTALSESAILEGVLFALLMLLEVNEDQQRLVQEHGRELLETQEWTKMVFDRTSGGSEEEERIRTLAAGVLVRCSEVVEKHQRLLMGDMMDF
ncbi:telomere length regulation protein-domain-containing protein [Macrophomina phaseolina]|uniref:Telomere length regulation protein-domain-containing protein n=1 Tax=Macrophomina phaseolina TaxID=35725 RepID=A0ABQ8GLU0_9PEZI|nr:telomere length regulation protein-domain-containing protein [Macrophomina phaseolina]